MIIPAHVIQKKRDGEELSDAEIAGFIQGLGTGDVTDYQATALLMAIFFQGMTVSETVALTRAMLESGDRHDLTGLSAPAVDKHSTGGVGDKVSLILAPLAAACGLKVPMMSGRGLGHSGGTLDKLESIQGFKVNLGPERFYELLEKIGCAMIGQSERICPADRKLYALRDVTGTVECIPLITASILSKKLAEGTQGLVLDVKVGSGAFMKTQKQARVLAKMLQQIGSKLGLQCRALLTDMNQPLGYSVGNSLEMIEAIEVLRGKKHAGLPATGDRGSADLKELTIQLCAQMLELGGVVKRIPDGRKLAHAKLQDGSAWKVFQELVREQEGEIAQITDLDKLPLSRRVLSWRATKRGFISAMDTEEIGRILVELGGGRKKASDKVDHGVGFVFHKKLGAKIGAGDPIATVFAPENMDLIALEERFHRAVTVGSSRKPVPKLILELF